MYDIWIYQGEFRFILYEKSLISVLQENRMTALDMRSRCNVAVDDINYSKNRYTDVLPCMQINSRLYILVSLSHLS